MKIRTQFILTMLLFGVILVAISASALITNRQVEDANQQENIAHNIAQGAYELSYLSNDYVIYRESQQLGRWQSRFASFSNDVASLQADRPEEQALVRNIQANQQRLKEVFDSVLAAGASNQTGTVDPAFLQVAWSRIAVQSQGLISDAARLSQLQGEQADQLQRTNLFVILAMIVLFGAYIFVNYWLVQRRALKSIKDLQAGTSIVGAGNLDYTLPSESQDEIGDLSRSFNRMTSNLKEVTASKIDLEREVGARKEMEEELRTANEQLQEKAVELEEEVDQRKKAEAESAHLASFPEMNPNPIMELDKAGNINYLNPASRAQFPDLEKTGLQHPFFKDWQSIAGTLYPEKSSPLVRDINIGDKWFEQTISYLKLNDRFRIYVREITLRKKAEAELRNSQQFLEIANRSQNVGSLLKEYVRQIKEFSGCEAVGIRLLDDTGNIPYVEYDGFSQKFYESESPLSLKSDRCMCINVIKGTTDSKQPFYTDFGSFYMNGTTRFLATVSEEDKGQTRNVCNATGYESVALIPVRLGSRILGLIHLADHRENKVPLNDIQQIEEASSALALSIQRTTAEEALKQSEERYRSLFENMIDGYAYCQMIFENNQPQDFIYIAVNKSFEKLTGLKDVTGKKVTNVIPRIKETNPDLFEIYGRVALTGRPERFETYLDQLKVWLSVSVYSPGQGTFTAVFENITERKNAEESLQNYTNQLEISNKELESFSYTVSHDLRAPLRSMDGYSKALLEDYAGQLDAQGKKWLDNIRVSSQHMGRLIDDILGLSKVIRTEMKSEKVNLSELARSTVDKLKETEPERQVEFVIMPGAEATGDNNLLSLALQNLIGNAFKFTSGCQSARIEFGFSRENGRKVYFVRDNGAGFDVRYRDKLFKPFQRLHSDKDYPGTGIGLVTVQRIIQRHGGEVWAEGEVNKGATFYFTLNQENN